MFNKVVAEIQAVVDRLHSEGHTVATRLENALSDLKAHARKDAAHDVPEIEAEVKQVEADAAPVVAEVKADVEKTAVEVKDQAGADLAKAAEAASAKDVTKP